MGGGATSRCPTRGIRFWRNPEESSGLARVKPLLGVLRLAATVSGSPEILSRHLWRACIKKSGFILVAVTNVLYNLASQSYHWERLEHIGYVICVSDLHLVCSPCPPVALFSLDSFRLFTGTEFGSDFLHLRLYSLGLEPRGFLP